VHVVFTTVNVHVHDLYFIFTPNLILLRVSVARTRDDTHYFTFSYYPVHSCRCRSSSLRPRLPVACAVLLSRVPVHGRRCYYFGSRLIINATGAGNNEHRLPWSARTGCTYVVERCRGPPTHNRITHALSTPHHTLFTGRCNRVRGSNRALQWSHGKH
jgi:hypothetical protein